MSLFLQNCLSFPVMIFSGLFIIMMFYWICAASGLLGIDLFSIDTSVDGGGFDATGFAGWLTKLGLAGIPVTIILTLFTLSGWLLSYFSVHWFIRFIDTTLLRYLIGFVVLLVASFISIHLTAWCLKPLRNKLAKSGPQKSVQQLMGKLATVRSGEVTEQKGEAVLENGGAGLILQIRTAATENLKRGDRVVIISYDAASHSYLVVTEEEFRSL